MKCPKGWVPGGENLVSCETSKRWISLLGTSLGAIPTISLSTLPQCLLMVVLVVFLNSNKAVWVHPVHGRGQYFFHGCSANQQPSRFCRWPQGVSEVWMEPCKSITAARKNQLKSREWVSQVTFSWEGQTINGWSLLTSWLIRFSIMSCWIVWVFFSLSC